MENKLNKNSVLETLLESLANCANKNYERKIDRLVATQKILANYGFNSPIDLQKKCDKELLAHRLTPLLIEIGKGFEHMRPQGVAEKSSDAEFNSVSDLLKNDHWLTFMNHGYKSLDNYLPFDDEYNDLLSEKDQKWRNQVALYLQLLSHDKRDSYLGKSILDIGCGRGGGVEVMARVGMFKHAVGMDLNAKQIGFCNHVHPISEALEYKQGSALQLPFDNHQFDYVTNVESSYLYGDTIKFLKEVYRVLKPGGKFYFTDIRIPIFGRILLNQQFNEAGFNILSEKDITNNVIASCEEDASSFASRWEYENARTVQRIAAMKRKEYQLGISQYLSFALEKK